MTPPLTGYRILDYNPDTKAFKTLFHGINGSREMPTDCWIQAERKLASDGTSKRKYISGFHILPTFDDCVEYARKFKNRSYRVIVQVQYRGTRKKRHSPSPVILADRMYIPSNRPFVRLSDIIYA